MRFYRSGYMYLEQQIVLDEYQKTQNMSHPREFQKDFSGICLTDGYQVYHTLEKEREAEWYQQICGGESVLADAIMDRISYDSYKIDIESIDPSRALSLREVYVYTQNNQSNLAKLMQWFRLSRLVAKKKIFDVSMM